MLMDTRRITSRCLMPKRKTLGHIATAFIEEDGGRLNIGAKILASIWYILILQDSHARLQRLVHRKRLPWYAPSRLVGIALSAANVISMPVSWLLLICGKRNAARIASLGVLANPPSITITVLLVHELAAQLVKLSANLASTTGSILAKPICMIMPKESGDDDNTASTTTAAAATDHTTPTTATSATNQTNTSTDPPTSTSTTTCTTAAAPTSTSTTAASSTESQSTEVDPNATTKAS